VLGSEPPKKQYIQPLANNHQTPHTLQTPENCGSEPPLFSAITADQARRWIPKPGHTNSSGSIPTPSKPITPYEKTIDSNPRRRLDFKTHAIVAAIRPHLPKVARRIAT
jgi:hypothetical protein